MQLQVSENKFKIWRFSDFFTLHLILWMNGRTAASKLFVYYFERFYTLDSNAYLKRFHFRLNFVYPKFYM